MSEEAIAIGIDLGTTNSCVGIFRNGNVEILRDDSDSNITPSIVTFTDSQRLVGTEAKNAELIEDPKNTVYGIKRLLGREFNDPAIQGDLKHWPFTIASDQGKPVIKVRFMGKEKTFHPEEISAMVLEKMKSIAEAHLGKPVKDAVITVPAYFDNNQRAATRAAGRIAGLNVLRLMNEPTAAAVAYGLDKKGKRNVLVYDLGGGTFDVSVLSMEGATFKAKSITGDSHLGGEDFDQRMVSHFAKEIKDKLGQDVFTDKRALRRLARACEKAKIQLSRSPQATFTLDLLIAGKSFSSSISREKFDELNQDLFDSTLETLKKAITDSKIEKSRIDDVVLVGGSTRILKIENMLKEFFQKKRLNKDINPDEAVAWGAAVQAAQLAGSMSPKVRDIMLYDIVPLSLGVEVIGGRMSTIIRRNESIPIALSEKYTTTVDNQTAINFKVYEGERALTKDNNKLGELLLSGIPPEPRGYASVDCTFEIDDDCILHVQVRDRDTGNKKNVSIVNNSRRLNDQQLQQLVRDAEINRTADRMNCLRIEAMNELEFYVNDITFALKNSEFSRFVKPAQKQDVQTEIDSVSSWLASSSGQCANEGEYNKRKEKLGKIWDPISTMVHEVSKKKSTDKPVLFMGD